MSISFGKIYFYNIIRCHLTYFIVGNVPKVFLLKYTQNHSLKVNPHTQTYTHTHSHTHAPNDWFVEQSSHAFSGKQLRNAETNALNVPLSFVF